MLDNITKRRIDDCRDILVGKLPDPKSQIEQITIALIYKFMDDMDKEAIELGGTAKFFSDYTITDPNDAKKLIVIPFEKYSWDNLFDTKVSATEMLKLYSEAIEGMVRNPNIPELFANIFKNAYLPYRDPETLKMFLKTISEFEYTHSEKLGDAFEYLLSVMGSQGDAGQFRTPRHIIDFLVAAVNPSKTDTILDPACGTAGFLISAFKHIKEQNNNILTPDERKKLIKNFIGYDISPDMVRMSLVNLYLHGFSNPHIFEYDTLSSEEKWDETFDVILANPPFMSPKGGIQPHKKFTITSNRSEVLFIDYIAEHLNPKGRAGIIVPEGIIFQSGTAYKALRKMLVDKYLYAVVSLPAGVFNPYSGVKTSILLMDADLAKKTNDILFIKIDNDGYGLGAQRNAVKGGQLEEAIKIIREYVASSQSSNVETQCIASLQEQQNPIAQLVAKTEIGKSGDYNLSGERYKITRDLDLSDYPIMKLGDCCDIFNGSTPSKTNKEYWENGDIPWFTIEDVRKNGRIITNTVQKITDKALKETSVKLLPPNTVLLCCTASVGEYAFALNPVTSNQQFNGLVVKESFKNKLLPKFLYQLSSTFKEELIRISGQTSFNFVSVGVLKTLEIPLPPLSIQEEIVAEIESYQKIIDGAKMVVDNYKPRIEIDKDWEMVELGELYKNLDGKRKPVTKSVRTTGIYPYYGASGIVDYVEDFIFNEKLLLISEDGANLLARSTSIAFSIEGRVWVNNHAHVLKFESYHLQKYIEYYINSIDISKYVTGSAQPKLNQQSLNRISIPLPDKETQQQIVSQIEKEQELVNANKELVAIYEQKIKDRIGKVWGA
jgi:type I restriction enzyme M protein